MKIEEIYKLAEDAKKFDISDLENESLRTTDLYLKFLKIHSIESLTLKQRENEKNIAYWKSYRYYSGKADEPFDEYVEKSDLKTYINADEKYIKSLNSYTLQDEKVKYLEKVLKGIQDRTWQARNAIEYLKFQNGQ